MRILAAEDDPVSRRLIQKLLSRYGECETVADGAAASAAIELGFKELRPYDLVCLDVMMPHKDGLAVLRELRALEKLRGIPESETTKVVMVTALDDTQSFLNSFDQGSFWYVTKPIDISRLEEVLSELGFEAPGVRN